MLRGAVKDAYQIRERGFDTPANRRRIGGAGGLGAVYPHPSQERKHSAAFRRNPRTLQTNVPRYVRRGVTRAAQTTNHYRMVANYAAVHAAGRGGHRSRERCNQRPDRRPRSDLDHRPRFGKLLENKVCTKSKIYIYTPARARPDLRTT